MKRTRLAVAVPTLSGGGAERVVVNLLAGFVDAGLDVDLLLVDSNGPLRSEVPPDVRIVPLRGGRILASLPSLVRYLRRERPSAVLSHLDTINLVILWARRLAHVKTRVVVTTHTHLTDSDDGPLRHRLIPSLVARFYPWADAVVGVSRGVVEEIERRAGADRVRTEVIHNPVVTEQLLRQATEKQGPRKNESGRLILSVGRLQREKNHRLLIDAFARIAVDEPDVCLTILGEGPERQTLEERAAGHGLADRVTLPGFVRDPWPWYRTADVFVLSSDREGLPTVLVEALLFGCPIVSTDCMSGPAEILEDGEYGILVPPDDVEALARGIRTALEDPPDRDRLRSRALEFRRDRSVQAYLNLLFLDDAREGPTASERVGDRFVLAIAP